jgi:surfeit locus 1 family protein
MRLRTLTVAVVVIAAAAVCVRLGFWQLARLDHKRQLNARLRSSLSRTPEPVADARRLPDSLMHRPVVLRGTFDSKRHVLLVGRSHDGESGVHLVTPLAIEGDSIAVLVDRGWLPAPDGVNARPQDVPATGTRAVTGIADTLASAPGSGALRPLASDSLSLYSAEELGFDSLAARWPYPLARFVVRELPSRDAPPLPVREAPEPFNETMHLGYAAQWFAFALILLVGPVAVARARRTR